MAPITVLATVIAGALIMGGCVTAIPQPTNMPRKKMCVGSECREMSALDGGTTTRGHGDEPQD